MEIVLPVTPVVCVHGIFDTSRSLRPLVAALDAAGFPSVSALDLRPNDGSGPIAALAASLGNHVESVLSESGASSVDVVGFSMGALVSRHWIERLGGARSCRRFVSISGPHAGTLTASFSRLAGIRDMRRGSPLLTDLAEGTPSRGSTEFVTFRTPYDLMIVPSTSSRLPGVRDVEFPVALHRWMIRDERVLAAVVHELLR
ncbi:MAG: alpha/beta fold hydrolase [Polyangiaceae bacterium]